MVAVEAAAAALVAESPIRAEAREVVAEAKAELEVKGDAAAAEVEEREYKSDMRKLEELMSKLNPSAQEFVPSSRRGPAPVGGLSADAPVFVSAAEYFGAGVAGQLQVGGGGGRDSSNGGGQPQNRRRRNGLNQGRRRMGGRTRRADMEDSVRRTVYVSDIDQQVTEQKLAEVFSTCGQAEESLMGSRCRK